jgi:hypothetical protein
MVFVKPEISIELAARYMDCIFPAKASTSIPSILTPASANAVRKSSVAVAPYQLVF